jgi:glycosyltransferase involved in cell wall biosynthesis
MPDPEPLRCLFVLPSFAGGGAERVTLLLASTMAVHGIASSLVVLDERGPLHASVPDWLPVKVLHRRRVRQALPALARHVAATQPHVIFSSLDYLSSGLVLALFPFRYRPRLVAREANLPSLAYNGPGMARWMRLVYARCDLVIASSSRMAGELRERYLVPADRLVLLNNPVDVTALRRQAQATPEPALAGLSPCKPSASRGLYVASGRLVRQKGFDRLLECWPAMSADDQLVVLGEGPERVGLMRQAEALDIAECVHFPGFVPNPWAWYARADAVLLASRFEGMPNVALEALACGAPVIATPECGGIRELAARSSPDHVRVVPMGRDFISAMRATRARNAQDPTESRLPAIYAAETVSAELARHLIALVRGG